MIRKIFYDLAILAGIGIGTAMIWPAVIGLIIAVLTHHSLGIWANPFNQAAPQ